MLHFDLVVVVCQEPVTERMRKRRLSTPDNETDAFALCDAKALDNGLEGMNVPYSYGFVIIALHSRDLFLQRLQGDGRILERSYD